MTSGCKDIEIRKLFFGSIFTKLATKYNIIEFNKSDIKRSKESMQPRVLFYTWVEFCIFILVVGLKFTKVSVFFFIRWASSIFKNLTFFSFSSFKYD